MENKDGVDGQLRGLDGESRGLYLPLKQTYLPIKYSERRVDLGGISEMFSIRAWMETIIDIMEKRWCG